MIQGLPPVGWGAPAPMGGGPQPTHIVPAGNSIERQHLDEFQDDLSELASRPGYAKEFLDKWNERISGPDFPFPELKEGIKQSLAIVQDAPWTEREDTYERLHFTWMSIDAEQGQDAKIFSSKDEWSNFLAGI